MAFPDDLANVVVCKLHPAIGIARLSDNPDYYVFGTDPGNYKSNGLIKRQAVQFRVFAYGENHVCLGELTAQTMAAVGLSAVWTAKVANRKIAYYTGEPLGSSAATIQAEARSDANCGLLTGSLADFAEGDAIPLGEITPGGVFIPPTGGVYRRVAGSVPPNFPALGQDIADTTSDGVVTVELTHADGPIKVLPACIIVAPQDFSPDEHETSTLSDYLRARLRVPPHSGADNIHGRTARAIDEAALRSGTSDFSPGFEVSLESRGEVGDLKSLFLTSTDDPHIHSSELRVRYRASAAEPGAEYGQLTSGLCSTWQGDFTACIGYWNTHLPETAFLDEATSVAIHPFRLKYDEHGSDADRLRDAQDFVDHVDQIGVMRMRAARLVETERDPGDDLS